MGQFQKTSRVVPGEVRGAYQIALPIAVVDKIPRISSSVIRKRISLPISLVRRIFTHEVLQFLYVYASAVDAIARAQDFVDIFDKPVKAI
jgi:hypothetical protein